MRRARYGLEASLCADVASWFYQICLRPSEKPGRIGSALIVAYLWFQVNLAFLREPISIRMTLHCLKAFRR